MSLPRAVSLLARSQWAGILTATVIGMVWLSLSNRAFLSEFNWFTMLRGVCVSILVALSQMIMLGVGHMNLSVGALGGLVAIVAGGLMETYGLPTVPSLLVAITLGGLAGYLNGFLTLRSGLNSFVVTLATASVFSGLDMGVTRAIPFYDLPHGFTALGSSRIGFFPVLLTVPFVGVVLMWGFLNRTVEGRNLLAVGGNSSAAELSGISVSRAIKVAHVVSALLASTAGVLAVAQLGSAQPTIGSDWVVLSFSAPIIGGSKLSGGSVSIAGTVCAVFFIGLIQNAMVLLAVDPYWVTFTLGALVLSTVFLNAYRASRVGED